MSIVISIGQYRNRTEAQRVVGPSLADVLSNLPNDAERWWSGHLWKGDRRSEHAWESCSALMIDVDYCGHDLDAKTKKGVHSVPPEDHKLAAVSVLRSIPELYSNWHPTPRGLRVTWELPEPCTDKTTLRLLQAGASNMLRELFAEAGVYAVGGFDGYDVDEQALDLARLMWAPTTSVLDTKKTSPTFGSYIPRTAVVERGLADGHILQLLLEAGQQTGTASVVEQSAATGIAQDDDEIGDSLFKMRHDGENDGSLALMSVARRAVSLGIETAEQFARVARRWNEKRKGSAWSDDDLARRFEDSLARWEASGLAKVPIGHQTVHALQKILEEDKKYAGRLAWDVCEESVLHFDNQQRWQILNDVYRTGVRGDICKRYGYKTIPREDLVDGLRLVSEAKIVDRVANYLGSLSWDGVSRMGELVKAMKLDQPSAALAESYVRCTLMGAVARRHRPGVKHDCVLVLVGPEGYRKSTALATLAGRENFNDTPIDLDSKDGYLQIAGAWIHEWGEVESFSRKSDQARLKNFMSSAVDRYRAPYARGVEAHPRRSIFVGSANTTDLIYDPDSDRRWWVGRVAYPIDVGWIQDHRDQLWAEAVYRYGSEEQWHLTPEEDAERKGANEAYRPDNPLAEVVQSKVEQMAKADGHPGYLLSSQIYVAIGLDPVKANGAERRGVSDALRGLGYQQTRAPATANLGRARVWVRKW